VRLLEARDRLGGRVHTVQHGDGGVIEQGAQWLHGGCHANSMFNFAAKHNLLGEKVKVLGYDWGKEKMPGFFHTSSGRVINEDVSDIAWDIYEEIGKECEDYFSKIDLEENMDTSVNMEQFYWQLVKEKIESLGILKPLEKEDLELCLASLSNELAQYVCDDLEKASLALYGNGQELPGGDVIVPDGLKTVIDAMAQIVPPEVIKLGEEVTNIEWGVEKLIITTKKSMYFCDHVIVTVPLGVLKKNHMNLFTPTLDKEKITAINNMGEGNLCKIFLEWDAPWWMDWHGTVHLAWSRSELENTELPAHWYRSIFNFSPVEGQKNVLLIWVVGKAALVADRLPDHEIVETMGWLLRKFTGDPTLANPDRVIRHCWTTDPHTMGAYSYPSTKTKLSDYSKLSEPLPSSARPKLLLAGEHNHQNYWSFLHGARLAGIEQAGKIITWKERERVERKITTNL